MLDLSGGGLSTARPGRTHSLSWKDASGGGLPLRHRTCSNEQKHGNTRGALDSGHGRSLLTIGRQNKEKGTGEESRLRWRWKEYER